MKRILNALALATALVLAPVVSAQMEMSDSSMGMKSMQSLEKLTGRRFDIAWMSQMIEHHKGAVEMAKSVLENGKKDLVKKAAQRIVDAQSKEIKQLNRWLKTWYDAAPDKAQMALMRSDMKGMMATAMGDMPGMNISADPDKSFLEGMIPHHQSVVDMGQLALKKAARPELKTFARGVITDQSKEIAQYKAWLKTWK
jgi:uncharacterized protein (DUF305 family)